MNSNRSLEWNYVFNSIKDPVILIGPNGIIKNCNTAFLKLVDKSETQVFGYDCSKIVHGKTSRVKNCPFFRSKKSKKRESFTFEKDGKWFNVDVDPVLDDGNKILGFVHIMSDITEHMKADISLQESEEKFRTLAENINVGIYRNTVGTKGKFIEANPAIVRMFGFKNKKEFLAYNVSELYLHPKERNKFNKEMLKKGFVKNEELQLKKADGTTFLGSISAEAIKDKNGNVKFYDGIIEDITERKKAETTLLESENNLRTLFRAMTDIVIEIDYDGRYINIAPTSPKLLYKPYADIIGKKLHEIFPKQKADMFLESFRKCLKENKTITIEYSLIINNKTIWVEGRITPKTKNSVLLIAHDMTERKHATVALRESEKRYRDLFKKSIDAILIIKNGKFVDCNQSTINMLRYKNKEEFLNTHPSELSPEKQPDGKMSYSKANEMMETAFKNGSHRFEWDHKRSNGEVFPVEVLLTSIPSDNKNQILHTVWRDITDRKKAEKALIKEKDYYHSFVTSLSDWVWEMDMNGIHTYSNPAVETILGYKIKDVVGHHIKELWGIRETTLKSLKIFNDALSAGKGWKNVSGRFKHKNGSTIITESTATPIYDSENKLIGYRGIDHNITDRKKAEEALLTQNLKYYTLLLNLEGMVYNCENDKNWTMKFVSAGCLKLTGYKPEELIENKKISFNDLILPKYQDSLWELWQKKLKSHEPVEIEYEIKTASGEINWVLERGRGIYNENGQLTHLEGLITDITDRKKTEITLQESEKRFKYLFDQSPVSIWEEDFSKVHKYLNSLKKKGIENFKEYFENHLDEVKKCSEMVHVLDINEMTIKLFNAKNKKELITNLNTIFTKESLASFIEQLIAIIKNETRFKGECINRTIDGKLINVSLEFNVVPGYEKDYSRVLISLIDITEKKKAEEDLRNDRERLKMLNKIIRHDISNDFIVIQSAINIFRRSSDVGMIDEIEKRVVKSLKTIDSYRKYESFIDSNQDLDEIEIAELFEDLIVEFTSIKFNIEGKCKVFADEALSSIFTNLIINSIKHGNASQIDIKISSHENMCKIMFMDNGMGIPDKIKFKIFQEGFFYGKSGNTGIGLHIVKKTVERYGGYIYAEDNKPKGTVFVISLRQAL